MSNIIVATDYSLTAIHAADYAAQFAIDRKKKMVLLHAYTIALPPTDTPIPFLPEMTTIQSLQEENSHREILRLRGKFPELQITSELYLGDAFSGLQEAAHRDDTYLTIMGTSGETSSGILWGSIAMKCLRELDGPVLIVPMVATYQPIKTLLITVDLDTLNDQYPASWVMRWVKEFDAHLKVLNIQPLDPVYAIDTPSDIPAFADVPHSITHIEDDDMAKGVEFYLNNHDVDVIVVVPKKYNLFERLFHKSKSEMIARASDKPILAIHQV